ncbi:NAD(P)H-dependent flavin oxidoreductase [Sphingobium lactosutens]|nr:nitronate monooxygenase [Sphingobium lactosutens]
MNPLASFGLSVPIIQAPMAGVSSPDMAAAVSNAGALGSIAVGAVDASQARAMIDAVAARTNRPFNVNLFVHQPAIPRPDVETRWLAAMAPLFSRFDAKPPPALRAIYRSFAEDDAMLAMLVEARPAVVSFHFGLPDDRQITLLKSVGCILLASVTNAREARAAREAGIDLLVAQGYEAGGHRGMFDPALPDAQLGTMALTRLLVEQSGLPVIAAGGIMDGRGVRAALNLGAVAAQMGTAFIACPESDADAAYRAVLFNEAAHDTVMTHAVSGRPARCLRNAFVDWGEGVATAPPDYPIAYDAGKALHRAARAHGETGFGAQWAGQGAPLARAMPAAELVARIAAEMAAT